MNKLYELLKAGVITMRLLTFIIVGSTVYMWVSQIPIDKTQEVITVMVVGFYFGGETFAQFSKFLLEKYIKHFEEKH